MIGPRLDEPELIALLRGRFLRRGRGLELGIGDDAAVIRFGGERLLLAKDLLVEGVDFRRAWQPPRFLGRKSLNVNLSDIAAMGGRPLYALLGLALPKNLEGPWVEDVLRGFGEAAEEHGVLLVGGDLSRADRVMISVTIAGRAEKPVLRTGAKPGDFLFVSGTLGDAAGGLRLLKRKNETILKDADGAPAGKSRRPGIRLVEAFLDPQPRVALGLELARRGLASAMIDLSDGLSVDLGHLCRESRVGAEVWASSLPLSSELRMLFPAPLNLALHGGEDFELLFSARPAGVKELLRLSRRHPLYPVGRVVRGEEIILIGCRGRRSRLPERGWRHFSSR
ncbi:MAG: thiamine-phosphate kinase [Candidatus Aminicenantes bacterium]|nr:thiamine-phosphate kinase [Candidatus Aminicenantes bacterium]